MKKLLLLFLAHSALFGLRQSTREMIIICDCGNENIERLRKNFSQEMVSGTAMIKILEESLTQQIAPILVTGQLMDFFIACKDDSEKYAGNQPDNQEMQFYQACAKISLDNFLIKQIRDAQKNTLYLIIPKIYLEKYGKTNTELGLHIQEQTPSNKTVTYKEIQAEKTARGIYCEQFLVENLKNIFVTLPQESYTDSTYESPFVWTIFLTGHGIFSQKSALQLQESLAKRQLINAEILSLASTLEARNKKIAIAREKFQKNPTPDSKQELQELLQEKKTNSDAQEKLATLKLQRRRLEKLTISNSSMIAGMTIEAFTGFLQFLNTRIVTNVLVYVSCSSGGQNFVDPFKTIDTIQMQSATGPFEKTVEYITTLKYPIVTASAIEAVVGLRTKIFSVPIFPGGPRIIVDIIKDFKDFKNFFNALRAEKPEPLEKIIPLLINVPYKGSGDIENISLLPSIRMPHSNWITIPTDNEHIYAITNVKALAQGTKPLKLTDKQVILVSPSEVAFELDLNLPQNKFPFIISQKPGIAYHAFAKISTKAPFHEVIKGFLSLDMTSSKLFYIKELVCGSDSYTNVYIWVNATADFKITNWSDLNYITLTHGIYREYQGKSDCQTWNNSTRSDTIPGLLGSTWNQNCNNPKHLKNALHAFFNLPDQIFTNELVNQKEALEKVLRKKQEQIGIMRQLEQLAESLQELAKK